MQIPLSLPKVTTPFFPSMALSTGVVPAGISTFPTSSLSLDSRNRKARQSERADERSPDFQGYTKPCTYVRHPPNQASANDNPVLIYPGQDLKPTPIHFQRNRKCWPASDSLAPTTESQAQTCRGHTTASVDAAGAARTLARSGLSDEGAARME